MHRHIVRAALLASVLLPALIPGTAQAQATLSRVCVYIDSPHPPLFTGHAFLQLLPGSGPQAGSRNLVYGFAPKEAWRFLGGPGEVSSNATHHWDYKICYGVTPAQYDRMEQRIKSDIGRPPPYGLTFFNCTDWVLLMARVGGVTVPPAPPGRLGIKSDPAKLEDKLKAIGVGRTFAGGVVRQNPRNVAPNGGVDPRSVELDVDSYTGLEEFALSDPRQLAAGVHLVNHEKHLPSPTIGANRALTLRFQSVAPHNAIIAIDWGDGTSTFQHATATHRYHRVGAHSVRAVVVRNDTLFRVTFSADVVSRGGSDQIQLRTPHDGPQPAFPPLPRAIVPLPL